MASQFFSPWMGNSHIAFNFRLSFHVIFIFPIQVIFILCTLWLLLLVRVYLFLWRAPNIFCCDKRCGFPIGHFASSLFFVTLDMACTLAHDMCSLSRGLITYWESFTIGLFSSWSFKFQLLHLHLYKSFKNSIGFNSKTSCIIDIKGLTVGF